MRENRVLCGVGVINKQAKECFNSVILTRKVSCALREKERERAMRHPLIVVTSRNNSNPSVLKISQKE
jgi:hypothetical protein